jgi:hypothetical protein
MAFAHLVAQEVGVIKVTRRNQFTVLYYEEKTLGACAVSPDSNHRGIGLYRICSYGLTAEYPDQD